MNINGVNRLGLLHSGDRRLRRTLAGFVVMLAAGCEPGGDAGAKDSAEVDSPALAVAVSIPPIQWLVQQVAGDRAEVLCVMSASDDPHSFQATDATVAALMRCRAYFRIGVPAERGKWFGALAKSGRMSFFDLRDGIALRHIESHDHGEHDEHGHDHSTCAGDDPHIWLNPRLLKVQATTIATALGQVDPGGIADYQARLAMLHADLDRLDASIRKKLAPFPGRSVFVFHPSWGYFLDEYGLNQVAIERGGKEPSDSELTEIQMLARSGNVSTIFVQPQIAGRSASAIARAISGRVVKIDPLAANIKDNLLAVSDALVLSFGQEVVRNAEGS
ncbi:MAG: metal ABC transporter solute-binding protein, Zn/Mn family [Planctomycetota bacterium]|jgi:zinc transport system substrate-binding protein